MVQITVGVESSCTIRFNLFQSQNGTDYSIQPKLKALKNRCFNPKMVQITVQIYNNNLTFTTSFNPKMVQITVQIYNNNLTFTTSFNPKMVQITEFFGVNLNDLFYCFNPKMVQITVRYW